MRLTIFLFALLPLAAFAQDWVDRPEYDLALEVRAQSSAAARLPLLEQWKQKYPNSPMKQMRTELLLSAAQSLGDKTKLMEAAREIASTNENHFSALYWLTLLGPSVAENTPVSLLFVEKSAKGLLRNTDGYFAADKTADPKQKAEVMALAHRALGWVEWKRGKVDGAEQELKASLQSGPRNAEVSAWLGSVLATQKEPSKQVPGIWYLARASFLEGTGALGASQRRATRSLLEAAYTGFHGGLDGLDGIGGQSSGSDIAQVPAAFKIETATEAAQRRADEEMAATNPQLLTWVRIKRRLTGPDAQVEYGKMTSATLPRLKGYVLGCDQAKKPTEAILGLLDSSIGEIALKFDAPLEQCAEPGMALEFEGMPISFVVDPFRLTVSVIGGSVEGWPAATKK